MDNSIGIAGFELNGSVSDVGLCASAANVTRETHAGGKKNDTTASKLLTESYSRCNKPRATPDQYC
jgi:hypothetical protein